MATTVAPARTRRTRGGPALNEMAGIIVGSSVDEKYVLGRQAMFSMPDEAKPEVALMDSWTRHGLDPNLIPDARQPVDRFRSAASSVEQRAAHKHNGQRTQVLSNEVKNVGHECSYQVTIRRWVGDVIEHDKTMTVTFDKRTSTIQMTQLDEFTPEWAGILTRIQDHFDANQKTIPGQKIRNAVRETLLKIGAQNLRRKAGGVYFVPKRAPSADAKGQGDVTLPVLEGLAEVLKDLYGDDADFDVTKWANDEGEREIVRKHFALNANEKARELSEKAWERVRQGRGKRAVRSDLVAGLENERRMLLGQIKQFRELVNLEQSDVKASIDELDEALEKLDELRNEPTPSIPKA